MKKIIAYQVLILALCIIGWIQKPIGSYPEWLIGAELAINCVLTATVGGVLYCLRAVYLNKCVKKGWDEGWETWYYLRPLTSAISGFASYLILKAGLIVLEASHGMDAGNFGYLAFAFIAGLNVDKFVTKIEDIAKATFGIEKSRAAKSRKSED